MKRRLQSLSLCVAVLFAIHLMAQDNGGSGMSGADSSGASGQSSDQSNQSNQSTDQSSQSSSGGGSSTSGASSSSGGSSNSGGSSSSGGSSNSGGPSSIFDQQNPLPSSGAGQGAGNTGDLFGPAATPSGNSGLYPGTAPGGNSGLYPGASPSATPGSSLVPIPNLTGSATYPAFPSPTPFTAPGAAGPAPAPISLTIPEAYGGASSQTLTLGEGRLALPPITFTFTASTGYDDNIYSADSHYQAPKAVPPPTPVYQYFRPKFPTAVPSPTPLGVLGSTTSSANVGAHVQVGNPRTILIMDAGLGEQFDWNQPGGGQDFNANLTLEMVHELTPHAQLSITTGAVYQNTPNFALVNAPTNNGNSGGNFLNGSSMVNLTYNWSARLSTVTSYSLGYNILQKNTQQNLYVSTFGNQFRYTVSARNTVTAEIRETIGDYPSNPSANSTGTSYLVGLDTFISAKIRNTFSVGIESYKVTGGASQLLPYFESDTTLFLPRGAGLTWSNEYGSQESPSPQEPTTSYRTTLSLSEPLSAKLFASLSITYNYVNAKDTVNSAASYYQKQFQGSFTLGYTVSPRLSLSLSYNAFDFLTNIINSSYERDQVYFSGVYTFR